MWLRRWVLLLLLLLLALLLLRRLRLRLVLRHPKHFRIDLTLGRHGRNTPGGGLARSVAIFVAASFVEMDKLLVADEQITDVHISILSSQV